MHKWLFLGLFFLIMIFPAAGNCLEPEYEEFRILHTEEALTVGKGNLRTEIEAGVIKQPDASELYDVPRLRVAYGLSEWADIEFDYQYLVVRGTDIISCHSGELIEDHNDEGTGDLRIEVKMTPWRYGRHRFGLQGTTILPNCDHEKGLGTNEADFIWGGLLTSDWGRLLTHVNAGMAVTGDVFSNGNQKDYFIWGIAGEYALTPRYTLMAELYGSEYCEHGEDWYTQNISEGIYGNDRVQAGLALTGPFLADWRWGVYGFKGLTDHSNDWGVQVGLSKVWGIGGPEQLGLAPSETLPAPESFYNPMVTRTAYTIPERAFHLELAGDYIKQPDHSDLYVIPDLTLGWGLNAWSDFRLEFQYLKVENTDFYDADSNSVVEDFSNHGFGDVWVKFKFSPFEWKYGLLGTQFVTKVPSANDDGLGTDETDFFFKILFSTDWANLFPDTLLSRLKTHLNAGMAIEGSPHRCACQHDVFIWGALAEYALSDRTTLWAELDGSDGNSVFPNISYGVWGDNVVEARLGLTGPFYGISFLHDWKWGVTASGGLTDDSREWTASLGISRTWGL